MVERKRGGVVEQFIQSWTLDVRAISWHSLLFRELTCSSFLSCSGSISFQSEIPNYRLPYSDIIHYLTDFDRGRTQMFFF